MKKREGFIKTGVFLLCAGLLLPVFLFFPHISRSVSNLQNAKITLSDSRPAEYAKHTYYFQATTSIPVGGYIIIDLDPGTDEAFEDLHADHTFDDMTLSYSDSADMTGSTSCTLAGATAADTISVAVDVDEDIITFGIAPSGGCSNQIDASTYVEIIVGDGTTGDNKDIKNPTKVAAAGTADTYLISYETQNASSTVLDSATVRAAIIDAVTISAEVQATLSCSVAGISTGTTFDNSPGGNTYGNAGFTTTETAIDFGILYAGSASQSGQLLKVSTNGSNGFYFAVKQYTDLTSDSSDTINDFDDGSLQDNTSPATWSAPAATAGSADTYGHLGYGATDITLDDLNGAGAVDRFSSAKFAGLSTTYEAVLSHATAADGISADTNGQGYVVYKVEISGFQEADIYSNTISYLCTGRY